MDKIRIKGGVPLEGVIPIGGAKNAALPLMAASLLTPDTLTLANVPNLADIATMANLLVQHGVTVAVDEADGNGGQVLELSAAHITSTTAPYDLVRKMRASILVLGPLLARYGRARVSLPGGCAIGPRPVDLHIKGLQRLGAEVELHGGYIDARAPKGLQGAEIAFPAVSVGATENLLMAATLAEGETLLINAAREPEITDLANCLVAMGARIDGIGTDRLSIVGSGRLHGTTHAIIPDRIETGTYVMAAAATDGEVQLTGTRIDLVATLVRTLEGAGVEVSAVADGLKVRRRSRSLEGVDIMTEPYPGFPTDLQAQMMALMASARGASMITETIFENRFMHVPELARMGANITVHGTSALVRGVPCLMGAPVMATDLRASVSLVVAGLVAEGETLINRVYHLDRGYEKIEEKLAACGARIERQRDA
ncbi:MAG TPA: UDP-N-acetylglucosamine 1-carboxyvinyltransferase [Stellaceae bacterium]|jgi:UDP-N-acetylglucosamine 1-carboxyvinyltransferase|nr:UDP-N-acetylglucosamine 1-carboxyvinyltransferase [Stellaceae bacterium]